MHFLKSILLSLIVTGAFFTQAYGIGTDGNGDGKGRRMPRVLVAPQQDTSHAEH